MHIISMKNDFFMTRAMSRRRLSGSSWVSPAVQTQQADQVAES